MSNMEEKENVLKNVLTEEALDAVNENVVLDEVADSDVDEAVQVFENDPDVIRLKEQEAELMRLLADPSVLKYYKKAKRVGERRQVTQKEKKKKKAKRRMAKKSRR